jgi:WD40 repeat protein
MEFIPINTNNVHRLRQVAAIKPGVLGILAVAFSPDNRYIACGSPGEMLLLDYASREIAWRSPMGMQAYHLEFSFDGKFLAGISDGLYIWDIGRQILVAKRPGYPGYMSAKWVKGEKGERLVFAELLDGTAVLDPFSNWKEVDTFETCKETEGLPAISPVIGPDASRIVTLDGMGHGDNLMKLWQLKSDELEWSQTLSGDDARLRIGVCFHPSGEILAVGKTNYISLLRIPQGELISELRFERGLVASNLAFSPDGQLLAAGLCRPEVQGFGEDIYVDFSYSCTLWDWEWGAQLVQLPGFGEKLAISPDGSQLAITDRDKGIEIWNVQDTPKYDGVRGQQQYWPEPPDYDNQGRPFGHPNYGDDW